MVGRGKRELDQRNQVLGKNPISSIQEPPVPSPGCRLLSSSLWGSPRASLPAWLWCLLQVQPTCCPWPGQREALPLRNSSYPIGQSASQYPRAPQRPLCQQTREPQIAVEVAVGKTLPLCLSKAARNEPEAPNPSQASAEQAHSGLTC